MKTTRNLTIFLGSLWCLAGTQPARTAGACPELEGKDAAAHLEYLRGDRSKLTPPCVAAAMEYVGAKHYIQAGPTLTQYLDYPEPAPLTVVKRAIPLYAYPAVSALYSLGKPVVRDLISAALNPGASALVRQNAAETVFLIYGADNSEGIAVLVRAARAGADPVASAHVMDEARRLAGKCLAESRNECENAVLR
jgi:hypothetical protein